MDMQPESDQIAGRKRPWEPPSSDELAGTDAAAEQPADAAAETAPAAVAVESLAPVDAPTDAPMEAPSEAPSEAPLKVLNKQHPKEEPVIDDRTEEQKLTDKIAWFKQKNEELVDKLAHLQQQHGEMKQLLTQRQHEEAAAMQMRQQQMQQQQMQQQMREQQMREQQMRQEQQMRHEQHMRMQHEQQMRQEQQAREAAARGPPHNPDWTQQEHEGNVYFWNSATGESTYSRPPDFNPPGALGGGMPGAGMPAGFGQLEPMGGDMGSNQYGSSGGGQGHAGAQMRAANGPDRRTGAGTKGPPGANLFYFRKMNKGEHDDFTDADLVAEFSKFGELVRAEMSIDRLTGRSKGFGFVSFMTVMAAEAAIAAVHNTVSRGRMCELQRTRED